MSGQSDPPRDGKQERRYITIPDYAKMFHDHHGEQPKEDDFAKPVGRELS